MDRTSRHPQRSRALASDMSRAHSFPCATAPGFGAAGPLPVTARAASASGNPSVQDCAFIALLNAYRPHAGLSRLHGLAAGGRFRSEVPDNDIEDLVDTGGLFGFRWNDALWIPMFQFEMPGPKVAAGPQRVVAELGRAFDGWALASWFVQPNTWLASHRPIECLGSGLPDVLQAARADRFVMTG